ncbi:peptidase domain-containing ABC transporter [Listeria sp. FSL L7-1582]|uniref:peptidase domain-containing ABC transporter n=1 Tax=Listeria portnoyi TaxID=2713504 RepID=UPI00164DF35A|nr:peptidase domain-containing ABC transporter [Listeria portnoyi]MBC6308475.1 peptidase domain-containing ABC transporter [Listeria portnoyi]
MSMFKGKKQLKPTLQLAQTECGLCCSRTILDYFGYEISLTELRQFEEPGRDGLSFKKIKYLLEKFKLEANIYKVKNSKVFDTLSSPVIAFWKGYHFICIESFTENHVIIMDPSIGRIKVSKDEFFRDFSYYILIPSLSVNFNKRSKSKTEKWRKKYIWPQNMLSTYLLLLCISIIMVAITLSIPIFTEYLVDYRINSEKNLLFLLSILIGSAILLIILTYLRTLLSIKLIYRFSKHLVNGAFKSLLSLPAKYFTVRAPGEIIFRLNSLTRIQDVLGTTIVQTFLDLISGVSILIYIFFISPIIGTVTTTLSLLTLVFLIATQRLIKNLTDRELHEGTHAQSIQLDAVMSINNVKLGGYIQSYINDWESSYNKFLNAMTYRVKIQKGLVGSILSGVQMFAPLIILVVSLYLVHLKELTLGQAVAAQSIVSLLFVYINSIFSTYAEVQVASRYIELAEDIFDYPAENMNGDFSCLSSGNVKTNNLSYSYASDKVYAVKNIDVEISDGETIALVGGSGSGKTTLGKLLCSLFHPSTGTLLYDSINFDLYNLNDLRKYIGYIPQEANLHNRTIIENLKLGNELNEDSIIQFCGSLPFLDFIHELPMKYNTVISEMGANLSGGQRQRIHIAKILLQNPKILIMDEATSSLDNISQLLVYEELSKLKCTKVIIAHRLATILNADRIFVMSKGEIIQTGTHEELISENGLYQQLFDAEIKRGTSNGNSLK